MAICPHCGKNHPDQAVFCSYTGKELPSGWQESTSLPAQQPIPAGWSAAPAAPQVEMPIRQKKKRGLTPLLLVILVGGGLILAGIGIIGYALIRQAPIRSDQTTSSQPTQPFLALFTSTPRPADNSVAREDAPVIEQPQEAATEEIQVSTATKPPTAVPSATKEPTAEPTATTQPTPEPTTASYTTQTNPKDQAVMVFVPSGTFIMGSDQGKDPYFWGAEGPQHKVTLKAYWIYQTEVTNAMYQACTAEKACPVPQKKNSRNNSSYYGNARFNEYPVIFVTWTSAQSYCRWAGGKLPTEAQWEKAARGDQDTRLFPWGNTPADVTQANFCGAGCRESWAETNLDDRYADTSPVGTYPAGVSPYGALDMAGNVWEWVFDWFQPGYSASAAEDPVGPASSKYRVIRGGAWSNPSAGVRIVQRDGVRPENSLDTIGFRCVVEEMP